MKDGRTGDDHCSPDITQYSIGCDDSTDILKCKCDSPYTWNYDKEICDYKISCKTDLMKDGKTGDEHCKPEYTKYSIGCDDSTGLLKCKCDSPYTWDYDKEICAYKISCKINKMKDGKTGDEHCMPEITKYSIGCDDSTGVLKCKCDSPYSWDYDQEICKYLDNKCDTTLMKDGKTGSDHCKDTVTPHSTGCDDTGGIVKCICDSTTQWDSYSQTCKDTLKQCDTQKMKDGKTGTDHCKPNVTPHSEGCDDTGGVVKCKCDSTTDWDVSTETCIAKSIEKCDTKIMKDMKTGTEHCKDAVTPHSKGCDDTGGVVKCIFDATTQWDTDSETCKANTCENTKMKDGLSGAEHCKATKTIHSTGCDDTGGVVKCRCDETTQWDIKSETCIINTCYNKIMKDTKTGTDYCKPSVTRHSMGCDDTGGVVKCICDSTTQWDVSTETCKNKPESCYTIKMKDGKSGTDHCKASVTPHSVGCDDKDGVVKCNCIDNTKWVSDSQICELYYSCDTDEQPGITWNQYCVNNPTNHFDGCLVIDNKPQCKCQTNYRWIETTKNCDKDGLCSNEKETGITWNQYCVNNTTNHFIGCQVLKNNIQCKCQPNYHWIEYTKGCRAYADIN